MKHEALVNATDLDLWAQKNESKALLAKLIRRLLQASGVKFKKIEFQSEEGIFTGGWDGFLDSPEAHTYFLRGLSGWEVSAQDGVTVKANKVYGTRTKNTKSADRRKTAFVFVTLRRWSGKSKWVEKRNEERSWRKVVALDATDLEAWLETEPSVHQWVSEHLGKWPEDVSSLDQAWRAWAYVTKPILTPQLILAGRGQQVDAVLSRLAVTASIIPIKADTRDEAVAFFSASLSTLPDAAREALIGRTLVVRTRAAWEKLEHKKTPLLLIALFSDRNGVNLATANGHTVIIPMDRTDASDDGAVKLAPLQRADAQRALLDMGCKKARVQDYARTARRSMMSLRRKLAVEASVQSPEWSKDESASDLIPALLLGAWQDDSEGDRNVYATIAGLDYDEAQRRLTHWAQRPDSPVKQIGSTWCIVSPDDLWTMLLRHITSAHIQRFEEVAKKVFGEAHPMFELPAGDRWAHQMHGKIPVYSNTLRQGIAENLAFIGAHGSSRSFGWGRKLESLAEVMVREALDQADIDWRVWATLGRYLPALAEAAPTRFIQCVEACLKKDPSVLGALFRDDGEDFLFSVPKHTGLVRALETLAWHSDYVAGAVDLLADLMDLDPITSQAKRPLASLCSILHPVVKNTNASVDDRLKLLGAMRKRKHKHAFLLFTRLMPSNEFLTVGFTHEPRWRDWPHDRPDRYDGIDGRESFATLWGWILEDAPNDPARCLLLAKGIDHVGRDHFLKALSVLGEVDRSEWTEDQKRLLWDELRDLHTQHANHRQQSWAMPVDMLDSLAAVVGLVEPSDPVAKFRWVFDGAHQFPRENAENYERVRAEVTRWAAKAILDGAGLNGVRELAMQVDNSWHLGDAVGAVIEDHKAEMELLNWAIASTDDKAKHFGRSLTSSLFQNRGWEWVVAMFNEELWTMWGPRERALFFASLSFTKVTWQNVQGFGLDVEVAYWREVQPWGKLDHDDMLFAASKFMEHGKPLRAITTMFWNGRGETCRAPSDMIANALLASVQTDPEERRALHSADYMIRQAHELLLLRRDIDLQRIAQIEWILFGLLDKKELVLYDEMAKDPAPFADIIAFMFKPLKELDRTPTEQEVRMGGRAYEVLKGWKGMPATKPDGTIDGEALKKWYRDARAAVEGKGRGWSDYHIGEKLRYAPKEADGTWPCLAVRDLIEELKSDALERGIGIEVRNSRGTRSVDLGVGDRASAAHYTKLADDAAFTYPRTAAMLRSIARSLEHDAEWEVERHEAAQDLDFHA